MAFTMLELQSARPDLDPGLVKILDTHQNQPAKALKLIAEWCDKNGY
ncbi:MAG: hypothetical protein ACRDNL_12015 [Spirillospora sp.]